MPPTTSSQKTEWVYSGTQHTPRSHTGGMALYSVQSYVELLMAIPQIHSWDNASVRQLQVVAVTTLISLPLCVFSLLLATLKGNETVDWLTHWWQLFSVDNAECCGCWLITLRQLVGVRAIRLWRQWWPSDNNNNKVAFCAKADQCI